MSTLPERGKLEDSLDDDPGPSTHSTASFSGRSPSPDEDAESAVKKRKVSRACDVCRKRKVRCDFVQLPSGNLQKCLNCFSSKIECTFTEDNKPRRTSKNYVQSLETKVERSEKLLELLCPDPQTREDLLEGELEDIPAGVLTPSNVRAKASFDIDHPIDLQALVKSVGLSPVELQLLVARLQMYKRYPVDGTPNDDRHEDDEDRSEADHLSRITEEQLRIKGEDHIENKYVKPFYLGKSSTRALLMQVMKAKNQSRGTTSSSASPASSCDVETDSDHAPSGLDACMSPVDVDMGDGSHEKRWPGPEVFISKLRPEYWQILPWEKKVFRPQGSQSDKAGRFDFPEPTLMKSLVDNYFKYINIELPLLHRPTLDKEIAQGLHRRDAAFGATVLLVCSLGARYSTDPRVRVSEAEARKACEEERHLMAKLRAEDEDQTLDPPTGSSNDPQCTTGRPNTSYHARGWKYFDQAWKSMNNHLLYTPPSLHDLQFYCLATEYLRGTSLPQASWVMIGIGVRMGQDIGVHRRRKKEPFVEPELAKQEELRKRAFWVMVTLDRLLSTATGRPCAILDESFDADLPAECDDEYWDAPDPAGMFKQPEGKPSKLAAFVLTIRLNQILAACLKTIYSTRKAKTFGGLLREQWEDKIISEMDSALNKWFNVIPPHLRWNTHQPNDDFFMQSAILHASYYHMQILVHRPFIPSPSHPTPIVDFPSLAICTHAARSLIHIGLAQLDRLGDVTSTMPLQLLSAAVILLLRIWDDRRTGKLTEQMFKADMADLNSCLKILDSAEKRWYSAGKLRVLMQNLIPDEGVVGTVVTEFSKKGRKRTGSQPNAKGTGVQSPPISAPSPFAAPAAAGWDSPSQQQQSSYPGDSTEALSPMASTPNLGVLPSPSMQQNTLRGNNYGQPLHPFLTGVNSSMPSADPNAQWSVFASGSGVQAPQQSMFADTQQPSSEAWGPNSNFYQAKVQARRERGSPQGQDLSFFEIQGPGVLSETAIASAALDPNLFTLAGMNSFPSGDFEAPPGSFSQGLSPFWPPAAMSDATSAETSSDSSGVNTTYMPFDSWQYLTGLVDLTSRNDWVDHLFPNPPQPGYGSGSPL